MILSQVYYWENSQSDYIYVGEKWGIRPPNSEPLPFLNKKDLSKKKMINLAIIKVKEDLDYLDFYIIRYIEVLKKINRLDDETYNLVKYGTTDVIQIYFIKYGLSKDLAKLIVSKYREYISIENLEYKIRKEILEVTSDENEILINELRYYLEEVEW